MKINYNIIFLLRPLFKLIGTLIFIIPMTFIFSGCGLLFFILFAVELTFADTALLSGIIGWLLMFVISILGIILTGLLTEWD